MSAFDALRAEPTPVEPDRRFADDLRARLVTGLAPTIDLPERSPTMTSNSSAETEPRTQAGVSITPYLAVREASRALDWYVEVFGARETVRYVGDDGRVGHAEIDLGGASFYLSDEYPDHGAVAPATLGGSPVSLNVNVDDVDAVWERAVAAGADGQRPPEDQPYGERSSTFVDPFGHRWMVQTTIAHPTIEEIDAAFDDFTVVSGDEPDDAAG